MIAPALVPRKLGERIKTDRRDVRTRSQRLRTVVSLPIEAALREVTHPPIYQRIAPDAARFCAAGLSDHAIGLRLRVADKTAAKAIRWFLARSDGAS